MCGCVGCDFGVKQNGDVVDDVVLPPWAKTDPRLFVLKHRQVPIPYMINMTIILL